MKGFGVELRGLAVEWLECLSRIAIGVCVRALSLLVRIRRQHHAPLAEHLNRVYWLSLRTMDSKLDTGLLFTPTGVSINKTAENISPPPKSLCVEFSHARMALTLLMASDQKRLIQAMADKKIKISGDLSILPWFARLAKLTLAKAKPSER